MGLPLLTATIIRSGMNLGQPARSYTINSCDYAGLPGSSLWAFAQKIRHEFLGTLSALPKLIFLYLFAYLGVHKTKGVMPTLGGRGLGMFDDDTQVAINGKLIAGVN